MLYYGLQQDSLLFGSLSVIFINESNENQPLNKREQ